MVRTRFTAIDRTRRCAALLLVAFLAASWSPWFHALGEEHAWCETHAQVEHGKGHGGLAAGHGTSPAHGHTGSPHAEPRELPGQPAAEGDAPCGLTWVGPSHPSALAPLACAGLLPAERVAARRVESRAHVAEALWRLAPKTSPPA